VRRRCAGRNKRRYHIKGAGTHTVARGDGVVVPEALDDAELEPLAVTLAVGSGVALVDKVTEEVAEKEVEPEEDAVALLELVSDGEGDADTDAEAVALELKDALAVIWVRVGEGELELVSVGRGDVDALSVGIAVDELLGATDELPLALEELLTDAVDELVDVDDEVLNPLVDGNALGETVAVAEAVEVALEELLPEAVELLLAVGELELVAEEVALDVELVDALADPEEEEEPLGLPELVERGEGIVAVAVADADAVEVALDDELDVLLAVVEAEDEPVAASLLRAVRDASGEGEVVAVAVAEALAVLDAVLDELPVDEDVAEDVALADAVAVGMATQSTCEEFKAWSTTTVVSKYAAKSQDEQYDAVFGAADVLVPFASVKFAPEPHRMHAGELEASSWFAKPGLHTHVALSTAVESGWHA
jgi:hypothetical protein